MIRRWLSRPLFPLRSRGRTILDYVLIITGAGLNAVALEVFLIPNEVVAGGVTGLAVIAQVSLGVPVGVGLLVLNLPLLLLQWFKLGGARVFLRTVVGVGALALLAEILGPQLPVVTHDRLLVICYGGGLSGLGLALVFQGRGTTGGADILARLVQRTLGWSVGRTMLAINVLVYGAAGLLYGAEPAMVALLLSFIMARVLDTVLHGISSSRVVLIVTERPNDVREAVVKVLGRGLTVIPATGGHTGRKKTVLYAVVPRADIQRLKLRALDRDPAAFLTVLTPRESVGGFHLAQPQ
jgi:uncharacterized membrane-anchored protein YitT (DUF2179 family)